MNKTFVFSIGMATILIVSTMNFSIHSSLAFSQNSNQNDTMGQSPMMYPMNQTDLIGMEPLMVMGEAMMMPCLMMGQVMMGDQTMITIIPCQINPSMSGQMGQQPPMIMGQQPPMIMGQQPPMIMGQQPPMSQTDIVGMGILAELNK